MSRLLVYLAISFLTTVYLAAWLAPFLALHSPRLQHREFFYAPPMPLQIRDRGGQWHWPPFVYALERTDPSPRYRVSGRMIPIQLGVPSEPYHWMGMRFETRLWGLSDPSQAWFLLGSDELGRDLWARLLHGARFSLTIGLVAIALTLVLGVGLGGLAGYAGGWLDSLLMRVADLFLSIPVFFLILGLRATVTGELSTSRLFLLIACIFALVGWAGVARVVRGQVLSLRDRAYVLAARVSGASHWRILTRHILPFTSSYLAVQASVLVPSFILGEITLSFLGVGVQAPDASWGTLLTAATSLRVMSRFPWLLTPALCIFLTVLAFNLIADEMKAHRLRNQLW